MLFCPRCANLLLVELTHAPGTVDERGNAEARARFYCQVCPYGYVVEDKYEEYVPLKRKVVDDVLGGEEAWRNVDQTGAVCPKCSHGKAYFFQVQIRSGDEPMSVFYKCVKCEHRWREG